MTRILIVEDDINTLELIKRYFVNENYLVEGFHSVKYVMDYVKNNTVDLCILDVMIGHDNGFDLLKEIKAFKDIPIIFVTAKTDEFDRIYGIEIGADDYLTKPFSPRELIVRANRLLSRISTTKDGPQVEMIRHGSITVNTETMEVKDQDTIITLTLKEYEVLLYMLNNPKIVLSRDVIINNIWGYDAFGQTRMVDDIIKRLRKKLTISIDTVWGVGYRLHE